MGFNKAYLPDVKELRKQYKENPESMLRWLKKTDAFFGSSNSIKYVNKLIAEEMKRSNS